MPKTMYEAGTTLIAHTVLGPMRLVVISSYKDKATVRTDNGREGVLSTASEVIPFASHVIKMDHGGTVMAYTLSVK